MADKVSIPDALTKREHLYGEAGEQIDLVQYGDAFYDEGRMLDALRYYMRAKNSDRVGRVLDRGIDSGDFNLLAKIDRSDHVEVTQEQWRRAAQNALSAGKLRYAVDMYKKAGDEERAAEVRAKFAEPEDEPVADSGDKLE